MTIHTSPLLTEYATLWWQALSSRQRDKCAFWDNVLAKLVAERLRNALRFVPCEGRNRARKLPFGDAYSAIALCLDRTTDLTQQTVGQMHSPKQKGVLRNSTVLRRVFGHACHDIIFSGH